MKRLIILLLIATCILSYAKESWLPDGGGYGGGYGGGGSNNGSNNGGNSGNNSGTNQSSNQTSNQTARTGASQGARGNGDYNDIDTTTIHTPDYTDYEKFENPKSNLVPRQVRQISRNQLFFPRHQDTYCQFVPRH